MRLLVFQHITCEHPGQLRQYLANDNINWDAVELDRGDTIPDLEAYDALWVMGGPMDVWDIEENPWLIEEKRAIRHWVCDLKRPYLGLIPTAIWRDLYGVGIANESEPWRRPRANAGPMRSIGIAVSEYYQ